MCVRYFAILPLFARDAISSSFTAVQRVLWILQLVSGETTPIPLADTCGSLQVLELEANTNNDEEAVEEEPHVEVAPVVPWSPSAWRKQYEKQRRVIIELWDACQVSIIHRTQFYLLFKGDPADAIYLEVELRRLNWLQENSATAAFEATHSGYQSASSEDLLANTSPLSAG